MKLNALNAVYQRELAGYFNTPIAYVFMVIFVEMAGLFTFYIGDFFGRDQADLRAFFDWHPWLYLFLIPALAMRLWARRRHIGTSRIVTFPPYHCDRSSTGKISCCLDLYRPRSEPDNYTHVANSKLSW